MAALCAPEVNAALTVIHAPLRILAFIRALKDSNSKIALASQLRRLEHASLVTLWIATLEVLRLEAKCARAINAVRMALLALLHRLTSTVAQVARRPSIALRVQLQHQLQRQVTREKHARLAKLCLAQVEAHCAQADNAALTDIHAPLQILAFIRVLMDSSSKIALVSQLRHLEHACLVTL